MDLIKQFPDISMKEREKFRLRQKLYPKGNLGSLPAYEKDKNLINSFSNEFKKWTRLILTVLIVFTVVYIIILTAVRIF